MEYAAARSDDRIEEGMCMEWPQRNETLEKPYRCKKALH